ncbi:recombinase family protein [Streptomyces rochei]|uniref:recombinase family protein n=1 Tax=Streptomyces rochei TaxID=1928 RepID=UPI0037A96606
MPYAPEYLHLVFPGVTFEGLLYGRNSDDAIGQGNSVEDQLSTGRTLCAQHNWRIGREFKDTDISASRHARRGRDDFEALLDTIANEPAAPNVRRIVVAFNAARYYRDLEAYVRLRKACMAGNVLLCYNGQVYDLSRRDDRKSTAQHAVDAEDEAEGIRDQNLRTTRLQAEAGMPHGKTQFGYTRTYQQVNGRRRCTGQTEDDQGTFVVQALRWVDSGRSIKSLVRWLRSTPEAARPDGKPWDEQTVRRMLLNRTYLGERVWRGTYVKAVWEPLKGLESPQGRAMFNRVTAMLTDPSRRTARGQDVAHLLSYIGLCGECGDHAMLRANVRRTGRRPTMDCDEKHDTSIGEDVLNAYVEEAVIDWFSSKSKARTALLPADDEVETRAAAAQRLVNAYEEQLAEAKALSEEFDEATGRFKLSVASLASMEQRLLPKLEAARKELRSLTGLSPLLLQMLEADDPDLVWNGRPETERGPAVPGLTLEQKREVIRSIVTVRLYKASTPGARKLEPGRVRLAFVGEPGFRARPLRAPATAPSRLPGPRAASSGTSKGSRAGAAGAS